MGNTAKWDQKSNVMSGEMKNNWWKQEAQEVQVLSDNIHTGAEHSEQPKKEQCEIRVREKRLATEWQHCFKPYKVYMPHLSANLPSENRPARQPNS